MDQIDKGESLDNFVASLKKLDRAACAVIAAVGVDVPLTVPDRDYSSMSPKDCYEAGLLDGAAAVRQAIRAEIDRVLADSDVD